MAFTLLACSDLRAQKINLEFPFSAPPTSINELRRILERTFRKEEEVIKRAVGDTSTRACEPFTISRIQRYEDDQQAWKEVTAPEQLQTYDQLYLFRRGATKADISPQRELPPPRQSTFFNDAPAGNDWNAPSPASSAAAAPYRPSQLAHTPSRARDLPETASVSHDEYPAGGAQLSFGYTSPPKLKMKSASKPTAAMTTLNGTELEDPAFYHKERTTPERVEYLFHAADQARRGFLSLKDFEVLFRRCEIRFPSSVTLDLFEYFATDVHGERRMAADGFRAYAAEFPVAVNVAYQRLANHEREEALQAARLTNVKEVSKLQQHIKDLEARLAQARKALHHEERKKTRLQENLAELQQQRDPDTINDEAALLEKEVSVFRYRARLRKEERDYERLTMERRRRTAHQDSLSSPMEYGYDGDRYGPRD